MDREENDTQWEGKKVESENISDNHLCLRLENYLKFLFGDKVLFLAEERQISFPVRANKPPNLILYYSYFEN